MKFLCVLSLLLFGCTSSPPRKYVKPIFESSVPIYYSSSTPQNQPHNESIDRIFDDLQRERDADYQRTLREVDADWREQQLEMDLYNMLGELDLRR